MSAARISRVSHWARYFGVRVVSALNFFWLGMKFQGMQKNRFDELILCFQVQIMAR